MDKELYKLCKEVYEKTKWGYESERTTPDLDSWRYSPITEQWNVVSQAVGSECPLYTSDYLLEKLPPKKQEMHLGIIRDEWEDKDSPWLAGYFDIFEGESEVETADIPLKALLKLTLALHDASELTPKEVE